MRRTAIALGLILVLFVLVMFAVACRPTTTSQYPKKPVKEIGKVENASSSVSKIRAYRGDSSKMLKPGQRTNGDFDASRVCTPYSPARFTRIDVPKVTSGTLSKGGCLPIKNGETIIITTVKKLDKDKT